MKLILDTDGENTVDAGASLLRSIVERDQLTTRLVLSGEIDMSSVPALADALARVTVSAPSHLILDMSRVNFLNAAGAVAILDAVRRRPVGSTAVVADTAALCRPLQLLGAGMSLEVHSTVSSARAALLGQGSSAVG